MSKKQEGQLYKKIRELDANKDFVAQDWLRYETGIKPILDDAKADIEPKFIWVEDEPGGYARLFKKDLLEHFAKIEKWFGNP